MMKELWLTGWYALLPVQQVAGAFFESTSFDLGGESHLFDVKECHLEGVSSFQLFSIIFYTEHTPYLKPEQIIRICHNDDDCHVFFFIAVPVRDGKVSENEDEHYAIIYNIEKKCPEFIKFEDIQKTDSTNVAWDEHSTYKDMEAFFANPIFR